MLADYLKAAIPTPAVLLGQALKPFSLGHNLILLRHESAFLKENKPIKLGHLIFGVFICCQTFEEALASIEDPELGAKLKLWGKKIGDFDLREKAIAFKQYLRDGSALPELLNADAEGIRTPGAPFLQLVKITLQADLHNSRSEALNMPLGEALHDYFAYWERKGSVKIMGPDEREHMDAVKELRKEIAREGGWIAL